MIDQKMFKEKVTLVNVDGAWYATGTDICKLTDYKRPFYLFKTYCNKDNYIKALVQDEDIKREKILVNSDGILEICNITHKSISDENRKILNSVIKELNRLNNADEKDLIKEEIERLKGSISSKDVTIAFQAGLIEQKKIKIEDLEEENIELKKINSAIGEKLTTTNKLIDNYRIDIEALKDYSNSIEKDKVGLRTEIERLREIQKQQLDFIQLQENELTRRDKSLWYAIKARFR